MIRARAFAPLALMACTFACADSTEEARFKPEESCPSQALMSLSQSRAAFDAAALAANHTYSYEVRASSFTGWRSTTTIRVESGVVVGRTWESWQSSDQATPTETWTEATSDLGTHSAGAAVKTIPELYTQCEDEILPIDASQNTMYLATDCNGFLRSCGYVPNGCVDDCFRGISVSKITIGP